MKIGRSATLRLSGLLLAWMLAACANETPGQAPAGAYALAKDQAFELGHVLAGIRACDGDAWEAPFHDFMAAKRARGLDDQQTAMIAVFSGAAEARAAPEMLDCSPAGQARRAAALADMRARW